MNRLAALRHSPFLLAALSARAEGRTLRCARLSAAKQRMVWLLWLTWGYLFQVKGANGLRCRWLCAYTKKEGVSKIDAPSFSNML